MSLGGIRANMAEQRALLESFEMSRPNTTNDERFALELHCQLNNANPKKSLVKRDSKPQVKKSCTQSRNPRVQENFCDPRVYNEEIAAFYESEMWGDIPEYERSMTDGSCFFDSVRMCLHTLGHWERFLTSEKVRKYMIKKGRDYLISNEGLEHTGRNIRDMISQDARSLTEDGAVDDWFERMSNHNVPSDEICIQIISKISNTTIVIRHENADGEFLYESVTRAWGVREKTKKLYLRYRPQHYVPMLDRLSGREESRRAVVREQFNTNGDVALAGAMSSLQVSGDSSRDLRAKAAEARLANDPLSQTRVKQDLIAKLEELYRSNGIPAPFGLRSFSIEQLRQRINNFRK